MDPCIVHLSEMVGEAMCLRDSRGQGERSRQPRAEVDRRSEMALKYLQGRCTLPCNSG